MNGGSSLLTLPYEGISIEDVQRITYIIQLELGLHTTYLNYIRNHIDQLKGGRIAKAFRPAKMIHLFGTDANHADTFPGKQNYDHIMRHNVWLHNLPDGSTFRDAQKVLEDNDIVEACPRSIREFIYAADPEKETVKYDEYIQMDFRFFGIMPNNMWLRQACKKASELGYHPYMLAQYMNADPQQAANVFTSIALNVKNSNEPFPKPVALVAGGEYLVALDKADGIGGRNQEFCLAAALKLAGTRDIAFASIDTDGTDGPGGLKLEGAPDCFGGAIVDGTTYDAALNQGVNVQCHLKNHDTSSVLWQTKDAAVLEHGVSVTDITVMLIQ
jgi:glycerate-2-kinase